jgi:hypothetical protein
LQHTLPYIFALVAIGFSILTRLHAPFVLVPAGSQIQKTHL